MNKRVSAFSQASRFLFSSYMLPAPENNLSDDFKNAFANLGKCVGGAYNN